MIKRLLQLRHELGALGVASLITLAAAGMFFILVLQPMQEERMRLEGALSKNGSSKGGATNLSAFYGFLESKDETTDALAKLYAIGTATGVDLQSGSYRTQKAAGRLERYELALPVSGSYAQIRDFLNRALAEIPALSLDQMTLRRDGRNEATVQAELRMTLHKVAK
ncbi:MAG TPA: GspMb/PilO family protein [Burkholderiales bacterium]|nr:GspMb/PilO family protein [Burkholderiales bacterium]